LELTHNNKMGILDDMMEAGKDIMNNPGDYLNDPSKILSLLGQEVLDELIDKVATACNEKIQSSGLDPLIIEDIAIPFSLEKMSEAFGPLGGLMSALCSCLAKTVEGEIYLRNGQLLGLATLARTLPTKVEVVDGSIKLSAGIGLTNLQSPFEPSLSVYQPSNNPEVSAMIEKVGILCSLTLPLQGASTAGSVEFDPPLDDIPVEVDVKLHELAQLEPLVKSQVIDPVRNKLVSVLRSQVRDLVQEKLQSVIPGLGAFT